MLDNYVARLLMAMAASIANRQTSRDVFRHTRRGDAPAAILLTPATTIHAKSRRVSETVPAHYNLQYPDRITDHPVGKQSNELTLVAPGYVMSAVVTTSSAPGDYCDRGQATC